MINVYIKDSVREVQCVTPTWLREQIEDRREDGVSVCVRVNVQSGTLNMELLSSGCSSSGTGGGRPPTPQEQEIFDLWEKRGMKKDDFNIGQLVAFLNQLKSHV